MRGLKKKNLRRFFFLVKQIFLGAFDASIFLLILAICCCFYFYIKTPIPDLYNRQINQTTILYDRTGEHVLYEIHGEENRKVLAHEEIPDVVRIATIAAEDDRFYDHSGIDIFSILRAMKVNIDNKEILQGGSTITQQLARNAYLTREKTWIRKIKETFLALKIEKKYTKDEILDFYLNEVPYGANAYGIETAAETFFGKSAKDLILDEAAFLAALPKAPSGLSPYEKNRDQLIKRQKKILNRIAELELATNQKVVEALLADTMSKVKPIFHPILAPHFVFYVRNELENKYGKDFVESGGLKVYTSLDYEMQKGAEDLIKNAALVNEQRFRASNSSLIAIDPKSGEILTMVGSRDYFDEKIDGQVNVSIQLRQPGSAFKPIVYSAAFEKGFQPESPIVDAQTNFGPDGTGKEYVPRNYSGDFKGLVTMRQALAMSLNIPAIKTLNLVGVESALDMARRLGISTLNGDNYGLSLAIGGGDITLLEGVSAFSVFANDGARNNPTPIHKIINSKGEEMFDFKSEKKQVIDSQIARKINSVLSDNDSRTPVFGPRSSLYIEGKQVAAKTGTTQWYRDAWTIGYTPNLAVGVWSGNNDGRSMRDNSPGALVSAPIWQKFMQANISKIGDERFADYDRSGIKVASKDEYIVKKTYYNNKTGKQISEEKMKKTDPKKVEVRVEYIKKETSSEGGEEISMVTN